MLSAKRLHYGNLPSLNDPLGHEFSDPSPETGITGNEYEYTMNGEIEP